MVWLSSILLAFSAALAALAATSRRGRRRTTWWMLSVAYGLMSLRRLALCTLSSVDYIDSESLYSGTDGAVAVVDVLILPLIVSGLILSATILAAGPHA